MTSLRHKLKSGEMVWILVSTVLVTTECPKKLETFNWPQNKRLLFDYHFLSSIGNTLTQILRPSLLNSERNWPRYINFKSDKVISTFRTLPIFTVLIFIIHAHWVICHYEERFAAYRLKWSHMVYFQTNEAFDKTNVCPPAVWHRQHQSTVPSKVLWISNRGMLWHSYITSCWKLHIPWLLSLGHIPSLVFDVFCSLKWNECDHLNLYSANVSS